MIDACDSDYELNRYLLDEMHRQNLTWHGAAPTSGADQSHDNISSEMQLQINAAASQVAALIVSDDRYARAIAFVSDPSESDEVATMLMQVTRDALAKVSTIKLLVRAEFDMHSASKDTILRTNSLASKTFGTFARSICRNYLYTHVMPLVRDITQSTDSLEINPDVLCKQPHILALADDERPSAVRGAIARNASELARCVSNVIDGLSCPAALAALPPPVISILKFVGEMSSEINMSSSVFVSSLFLLRLINPALIQPEVYDPTILFSDKNRRKLLLITKIMQTLGNRGKFGAKEAFMTVMIEHLEALNCTDRLEKFLHDILTVSSDSSAPEEVPQAAAPDMLPDDCLKRIRTFFCRHSAAILTRLQRESINRRFSVSDIISRDLRFTSAIIGLMPNSGYISLQAMQEFQLLYSCMFRTYASTPQFECIPELEAYDRENVCYSGPDALDGSAVVYICLERFKSDHLKIMNCILARTYLLFSSVVNRPFNILVDCSGVQTSSAAVVAVMKEMSAILLAAFEPAAKKQLRRLFLVQPSVDTLHHIQSFIEQASPKLWRKVVPASRWTSIVSFIAADRIMLPSSTLNSSGSLHPCIKINRKNKRQARFAKVMIDSLANIAVSSTDATRTYIKNEIMFCDIVALQDLSEPTKLMITHNSSSTFTMPPNQSQGYFFKSRMFPTKHSVTHRVYEFRNSSERDDLRNAIIIQRSLRMQISPTTLDPTYKGIELTPERGLYARVPTAVFVYQKIGRKTRSVIDRVLKLSCDSCLVMAGADIRHEISFYDIESCWFVGATAHLKTFAGACRAFTLSDEAACKDFVDAVRLGISACLARNTASAVGSAAAGIALFESEQPPQLPQLPLQPVNSAGHVVNDDFASISLGDIASGESTPISPARPAPALKRKASKFVTGLGARSQSFM